MPAHVSTIRRGHHPATQPGGNRAVSSGGIDALGLPVMNKSDNLSDDHPIVRWHRILRDRDMAALDGLLDEQVVFHSPVVHTPQVGKARVLGYLTAAAVVLATPSFRYVRQIVGPQDALLEFVTELEGVQVNGIDLIRWNEAGRIIDFKVMVRPLKAMQAVQHSMAEALQRMASGGGAA